MSQARDVMTTRLVTMTPSMSAADAIETLIDNRVSGAPVVDGDGRLVGIISEFKLLSVVLDLGAAHQPIGELMTTDVVTVEADTPLVDVAQAFISLRIRRLPVVTSDGELIGQVSRRDVLNHVVLQVREKQRMSVAFA